MTAVNYRSAMSFDPELADRVRELVATEPGVTERRMFGGLAFLINGHMSVTVSREGGLLVRLSPADADALVDDEHVRPMVMRGRELNGWLTVTPTSVADDADLRRWVTRCVEFARTLPPK